MGLDKTVTYTINTNMVISKAIASVKQLQNGLNSLSIKDSNLKNNFKDIFAEINAEIKNYQEKLNSNFKTKSEVTGLEKSAKRINSLMTELVKTYRSVNENADLSKIFDIDSSSAKKIAELDEQIVQTKKDIAELTKKAARISDIDEQIEKLGTPKAKEKVGIIKQLIQDGEFKEAEKQLTKLKQSAENYQKTLQDKGKKTTNIDKNIAAYGEILTILRAISSEDLSNLDKLKSDVNSLEVNKANILNTALQKIYANFVNGASGAEALANSTREYTDQAINAAHQTLSLNNEIDEIKSRIGYFFSLSGSVYLFERAIKQAYESVKDLDAAMTETAVVTDFSVGDMWDALPRYTEAANELGTTTLGAYETMTLFYQQGLKTNEVFEIGTETMKMARIANMDYTKATDLMTAALRGFNMELNETSAQRINDVYSELAAITAADTEEIADAMTRTASIASSAGMEFETTSAFLSQMIETTREAPENLGTAMKTIIARFQELKKAPSEIASEIDGESLDVNKIDTALKSIGVSLMDNVTGQFRELDDVFLEIASKWDGLDKNTQRYIATVAAGSRQQSRFIAMMSDYERTMELVDAANNSAGASQRQFEKTTESLESKLNKLKNAWELIMMGFANNTVIKGAVDLLTQLFTAINKVLGILPSGARSVAEFAAAFGLFRTIPKVFDKALNSIAKSLGIVKKNAPETSKELKSLKEIISDFYNKTNMKIFSAPISDNFKEAEKDIERYKYVLKSANKGNYEYAAAPIIKNFETKYGVKQLEAYNKAVTAGLDSQKASLLLLAKEDALKEVLSKTTEELTVTELEEIAAQISSGQALNLNSVARKKLITDLLIGNQATRTAALQTLGLATAEGTATKATGLLGKALLALPGAAWIAGITTALAALGTIIYFNYKWIKDNTVEERLKRTQEQTEKLKTAAEDASSAYDKLLSTFEAYDEAQSTLEVLTTGTEEWTKALIEANQQVLELLETYPELAKYLVTDENNQLTISEEGRKEAIEKASDRAKRTQTLAFQSQTIEAQLELELDKENLKDLVIDKGELGNQGQQRRPDKTLGEENLRKFLNAYEEYGNKLFETEINDSGLVKYSEELKNLSEETGLSAKGLYNARNSIISYNLAIEEQTVALKAQSKSLLKSSQGERAANSAYSDEIASTFAGLDFFSKQNIDKVKDSLNIDNLLQQYQLDDLGSGKKNLQQIYSELTGIAVEDIDEEIAKSSYKLKEAIAKIQISDQLVDSMDEYAKALENVSEDTAIKINAFLSDNGEQLTKEFTEAYDNGKLSIEKFAKEFGKTSLELANLMGFETVEELQTFVTANVEHANEVLGEIIKKLANISGLDESYFEGGLFEKLTVKEAERYQGNLSNLTLKLGEEASKNFIGLINEISSELGTGTEEFYEFRNLIANTDWANINDIDSIINSIEGFNNLNNVENKIIHLKEIFIDTGYALDNISLDNLNNEIKTTQELLNDLKDKDDYKFTEEEKNKYIDLGIDPSLFSGYGDEFYYIGDSLVDLKEVLQDNIQATIENTKAETQRQLDLANKAIDIGTKTDFNIYDWQFSDYEDRINFLDQMGEINHDAANQLLEDLSKGELEEAHKIAIDNILSDISSYVDNKINLEQQQDQLNTQLQTYNYTTQSVGNITAAANGNDVTGVNTQQSEEAATNALKQRARAIQETNDEVVALNQAERELAKATESGKKSQIDAAREDVKAAKAKLSLAISIGEFKEKLDGADSKIKDYLGSLDQLKEGTENYNIELGNIANVLNSVFDTDLDFSFFTGDNANNLANLKKAIDGDSESWNKLADAIYKAKLQSNDFITKFGLDADKVRDIVQNLDNMTFSIDGTATLDITSLVKQLIIAGADIAQVAAALEALGYTKIEFSTEWEYFNIKNGKSLPRKVSGKLSDKLENNNDWIKIPKLVTGEKISGYTGPDTTTGFGSDTKNTGGGGESSSSDKKTVEEYADALDKLYNVYQRINKELRMVNKYQERYNRLLETTNVTGKDLEKNLKQQQKYYELLIKRNNTAKKVRKEQINEILKDEVTYKHTDKDGNESWKTTKSKASKWFSYDSKYNLFTVKDIEKYNKLSKSDSKSDRELFDKLEEIRQQLEGYQGDIEEANDNIEDGTNALEDMEKEGREQYIDLENRVLNAIIYREQSIIDNLSQINDSITDANQDLINTIQNNLSKIRQDRENEETESDIADKERRLAYLRQDTSGANQLAIKQLEEEIAEQKQSYTDSLIDQKLEDFTEQNDLAADQRQQQIDLMQAQLDYNEKTGAYWQEAYNLIERGIDENGKLVETEELVSLLKSAEGWEGLSSVQQMDWYTELQQTVAQGWIWLQKHWNTAMGENTLEYNWETGKINTGDKITATNQTTGEAIKGNVSNKGNLVNNGNPGDGVYFRVPGSDVIQSTDGKWTTSFTKAQARSFSKGRVINLRVLSDGKIKAIHTEGQTSGQLKANDGKLYGGEDSPIYIDSKGWYYTEAAKNAILNNPNLYKKGGTFKTGGLADFTGPAWLDGTKTKPEMVLNQKDTQNFIQLKDILRDLLANNNDRNSKKSGDNYYEINIEVDSLGSDYDVEQMATKIKKMITNDARYRNVNAVNFIR